MKNVLAISFLLTIGVFSSNAQSVTIVEDIEVESLIRKHINFNRSTYAISGWRIQLLATTDIRKVEIEKRNFLSDHPDIYVDWEHTKPYYKLRVGAFATKMGATRLLKELKEDYPGAFLSKDNINISELLDE